MAKTNKYTSLNFNDIYTKKSPTTKSPSSSSSSSSSTLSPNKSYSFSASSHLRHGGMLLLSRPKPVNPPPSPPSNPDPTRSDPISLRPQGNTTTNPNTGSNLTPLVDKGKDTPLVSSKGSNNKFVPPHLRPGYVAREQNPVPPEFMRGKNGLNRNGSGHGGYGDNGRPKSGNGYDRSRIRSGGESILGELNRPRSVGNRPNSTG